MQYTLLTPGPLSTSDTVKQAMLCDSGTWDIEYKTIVEEVRTKLLAINNLDHEEYTTVLMQGSGTFGVESVLLSAVSDNDKLLVLINGVYGNRINKFLN